MTVLNSSNAFLGVPFAQHKSGQTSVQSFLFPGAVEPQTTVTVAKSSEAFLGIPFPQHASGKSTVQSFLFSGGVQPPPAAAAILAFQVEMGGTYRKIATVAY